MEPVESEEIITQLNI